MTNETVWVIMSTLYEGLYEEKFWDTEKEVTEWINTNVGDKHLYLVKLKRA